MLVEVENLLEILVGEPLMETEQELVRREFGSNLPSFFLQQNRLRFSYHTKWTDLAVTGSETYSSGNMEGKRGGMWAQG